MLHVASYIKANTYSSSGPFTATKKNYDNSFGWF